MSGMYDFGVRSGVATDHDYLLPESACTGDRDSFCPINYVYDYLPHRPVWLRPQSVSLDHVLTEGTSSSKSTNVGLMGSTRNSISLQPQAAILPLHTGLEAFRQNKYWKANEQAAIEILELFADDNYCNEITLPNGRSMSALAKDQLKTPFRDSWNRFTIYMWANADETRSQLLAQCMVVGFMFDGMNALIRQRNCRNLALMIVTKVRYVLDVWEDSSRETVVDAPFPKVAQRLIRDPATASPLRNKMYEIKEDLLACDKEAGNAGCEVLQALIDFCCHAKPPPKTFSSVRAYLDYRWVDIANGYTWACCKFSIRSSVTIEDPKFRRILHFIGDHISIVNDIASYEKEKKGVDTSAATSMINVVHVIMIVDRLEAKAAKSVAYAYQLHTENEILEELKSIKKQNQFTEEDWRFVDTCLVAACGNLFAAVVMSRYGGEATRVRV
ncbi:hypothetical protein ACLMJK_003848 [Lecanora helva]